jgi:hypothetical protein
MGNFNGHFKGIFDGHGHVPAKGLIVTQRFALSAIFVYQLALLYRFEHDLELCVPRGAQRDDDGKKQATERGLQAR